jgi:hypothetical protein
MEFSICPLRQFPNSSEVCSVCGNRLNVAVFRSSDGTTRPASEALSSCGRRCLNSVPEPATRSLAVLETSTSPGATSAARVPLCVPRCLRPLLERACSLLYEERRRPPARVRSPRLGSRSPWPSVCTRALSTSECSSSRMVSREGRDGAPSDRQVRPHTVETIPEGTLRGWERPRRVRASSSRAGLQGQFTRGEEAAIYTVLAACSNGFATAGDPRSGQADGCLLAAGHAEVVYASRHGTVGVDGHVDELVHEIVGRRSLAD